MTAAAPPRPLEGRVVLLTGALGGLGRAMTDAFAAAGAALGVHHLGQAAEAAELVAALRGRGVPACAVEADVADWDAVGRAVDRAEAELGAVDVLVNNAGRMEEAALADADLAHWQRTIDTDLTGVFVCCRHVVPRMAARGEGVVVNVSSQLAFRGARDYVAYCAAKAGVVGLTRALAREVGPAVRVNAVAPGPVLTPMVEPHATPAFLEERTRDLVSGRLGRPEEVAAAVVYLASPGASLLHGQTLHINGGGVMA